MMIPLEMIGGPGMVDRARWRCHRGPSAGPRSSG
jgi:hypothetical protein